MLTDDPLDDVLRDTALCNFADKKRQDPMIFGAADVDAMRKFAYLECSFACSMLRYYLYEGFDLTLIEKVRHDFVGSLLELGKGHLVLAGGALASIAAGGWFNDYDFFFYELSTSEAEKLLDTCVQHTIKHHKYTYFERSQYVFTIYVADKPITRNDANGTIKYQFIRRLYKTKGQILHGFDIAGAKAGFEWNDGLYFTIDGAVAFAIGAFMLDLTQRSTSFGARLQKYQHKGFKVYYPNISANSDGIICTCDGILEKRVGGDKYHFTARLGAQTDYEDDAGYQNCLRMDRCSGMKFMSDNYDDIISLPGNVVLDSIFRGTLWTDHGRFRISAIKPTTAKMFMGEQYEEFARVAFIDFNCTAAAALWHGRREWLARRGSEIATHINENRWKIDDPGSQSFGKFNPILADPRDWYDVEASTIPIGPPLQVGLPPECVRMFRLCMVRLLIPNDVVDVLLRAWLYMLANDALRRLLA